MSWHICGVQRVTCRIRIPSVRIRIPSVMKVLGTRPRPRTAAGTFIQRVTSLATQRSIIIHNCKDCSKLCVLVPFFNISLLCVHVLFVGMDAHMPQGMACSRHRVPEHCAITLPTVPNTSQRLIHQDHFTLSVPKHAGWQAISGENITFPTCRTV